MSDQLKKKPINTNLWRRYKITHVTVSWQERLPGKWKTFSKVIPQAEFAKHYTQKPPNQEMTTEEQAKHWAWRKTSDKVPSSDMEVEITHPSFIGTRTAKFVLEYGWLLTDCTHQEQNCRVPIENSGWRYIE